MQVEMVPIDDVRPFEGNPRVATEHAVSELARSIESFGWLVPCVVDGKNNLVTGHTRLLAARKLGMDAVPCVRAESLVGSQADAFRIVDNRLAELTSWDDEKLAPILTTLYDAVEELPPGFDDDDLFDMRALLDADDGDHAAVSAEDLPLEDNVPGAGGELGVLTLRCRRDVLDDARERCEQLIRELEMGSNLTGDYQ